MMRLCGPVRRLLSEKERLVKSHFRRWGMHCKRSRYRIMKTDEDRGVKLIGE
jgi:hypothetical protein